jgi:hypothetical protein
VTPLVTERLDHVARDLEQFGLATCFLGNHETTELRDRVIAAALITGIRGRPPPGFLNHTLLYQSLDRTV